jgi:hypothetical protein
MLSISPLNSMNRMMPSIKNPFPKMAMTPVSEMGFEFPFPHFGNPAILKIEMSVRAGLPRPCSDFQDPWLCVPELLRPPHSVADPPFFRRRFAFFGCVPRTWLKMSDEKSEREFTRWGRKMQI